MLSGLSHSQYLCVFLFIKLFSLLCLNVGNVTSDMATPHFGFVERTWWPPDFRAGPRRMESS
jgi:hypothetical protein